MRFEKISACPDATLPIRATKNSAGYDFFAYEDVIIPSHKIVLVPTGVKCWLESNQVLLLMVRSSMPRKMGVMLANAPGVVDADYAKNTPGSAPLYTDEGHILFQLWNFTDQDVHINAGDKIGQGVIVNYYVTDDDSASGSRDGGFGSTDYNFQPIFNTDNLRLEELDTFLNGAT